MKNNMLLFHQAKQRLMNASVFGHWFTARDSDSSEGEEACKEE